MDFRVLGPIEAWRDGSRIRLGGPKQRAVFATLLLRSNQLVSTEHLTASLWGEDPPPTSATQLYKYVSGLRALLGPELIVRRGTGYVLRAEEEQLDLAVFNRRLDAARGYFKAGHAAEAAKEFDEALGLWRGPALADGTSELIDTEGSRLEERRLTARIERIEAEMALGRHDEVIGDLRSLIDQHPYHERLRAQLMRALYRSGRISDALAVYDNVREILAEELGLDPGSEMRQLHQAILTEDASMNTLPVANASTAVTGAPEPAQLPPSIGDFSGREEHVSALRALLAPSDAAPAGPAAVVTVSGQSGVGKTALAVHVAHLVKAGFPDGQLYMSLRGKGAEPLDVTVVLRRFLRALGCDDKDIPGTVDEQTELYRTRIAARRVLIVLEDPESEEGIRPLLPGSAGSAVLITSGHRLAGLEGARRVELDVFAPEQAVALLHGIIGTERAAAEPEAAAEIVRLCGCLPLAVRIAATRLLRRPHWSLARLAARLTDERGRLDELTAGALDVRASLALGCRRLSAAEHGAFGLLALLDPEGFTCPEAARLLDVATSEAEDLVEALVEARLLLVAGADATGRRRFRFHELVRLHALETAYRAESGPALRAALARVPERRASPGEERIPGGRRREAGR
ncbi:BTAD domain-containing putative transcriptional regulator [Streptomyces sp. NPDC087525]|uniref:AfsR/SARP family transcriptional regulator n=1 Tax=Streptomyces sp. NPDC087525 TaxID=3365793 RepID=UPI00381ED42C